jgi:hypothetical protein
VTTTSLCLQDTQYFSTKQEKVKTEIKGLGIKVKKIKWGLYAISTRNVSFLEVKWQLHRG